ncbi:MAG: sulfite exporter TauE/SafE family protein [Gammaproteobacteria bacterium PRO9]|nr:sulfite exporter TauE/SafE family protein [Gammaproteobacteria bacterium PRO9]
MEGACSGQAPVPDAGFDLLLVLLAAFGAGLVDAMVGGGGLIQLPALLSAFPATAPPILLGTNKFASVFGTGSAVLRYARGVTIPWRTLAPLLPVVFFGALAGAWFATRVPPDLFRPLVPVLMAVVLAYVLWRKDLGVRHAPVVQDRRGWLLATGLLGLVAFYDGFFGPGTGSLLMLLFVRLHGYDFLHSAASARLLNVATNIGALLYFGTRVEILWTLGAGMAVANVVGAAVGVGIAMRHGSGLVRRIFVVVVAALIVRTAWQAYFGP